jgi:hypothetical protein
MTPRYREEPRFPHLALFDVAGMNLRQSAFQNTTSYAANAVYSSFTQ